MLEIKFKTIMNITILAGKLQKGKTFREDCSDAAGYTGFADIIVGQNNSNRSKFVYTTRGMVCQYNAVDIRHESVS